MSARCARHIRRRSQSHSQNPNGCGLSELFLAPTADAEIILDDPRPGDVPRLWADASKAREMLGYSPRVPLRQGLMNLKQWYLASGQTAEELLEQEVVHNWELETLNVEKRP